MNVFKLNTYKVYKSVFLYTILSAVLIFSTFSCKKHTTPNRTERIIEKESWNITSFLLDDVYITSQFTGMPMTFDPSGAVYVKGISGSSGQWSTGANKNPAILYMNSFNGDPLFALNNDWEVTSLTKKVIELESDGNQITLTLFETD